MQNLALSAFVAIGGIAVVFRIVDKALPEYIHKIFVLLYKVCPKAKEFMAANIAQEKELLKTINDSVEKEIDDSKETK